MRSPTQTRFEDLPHELSIFPLSGALLLPWGRLPLNIFEPRYLNMTLDALKTGRIFGMTDSVFKVIQERNIKLEAWQVQAHYQDRIEAENYLSQLINTGHLKPVNTVVEGIDNAALGILSQYETNVYGKLQLKFA